MLTIEVKMDGNSSTASLLFPHRSIEAVLEDLSGSQYGEATVDTATAAAVRTGLSAVDVEVRAEIASAELPVSDVLGLRPGDVIRFGTAAAEGVIMFAGHVPAHRARPGRNGNRRAIQIVQRLGGDR
jgi:flagellar motor switch protein FliM